MFSFGGIGWAGRKLDTDTDIEAFPEFRWSETGRDMIFYGWEKLVEAIYSLRSWLVVSRTLVIIKSR